MQAEQNTRKMPDFLVSIYARILNLENAITKTEALYNESDLKVLELFESWEFQSLTHSYIPINKRLNSIQKALAQSQNEPFESTAELNLNAEKQVTPKVQNVNDLQGLKIRLKEKQEQRRTKKTYERRKRIPSQEEVKKAKAYLEEREKLNQDLLHEQRQQTGFISRQKLLNSKCAACGKIPDFFGRCGCS